MSDHVHMIIAIPPKYVVSQVIDYIKGKSAIPVARVYGERRRIRSCIRGKEHEDQRLDQMKLGD